MTQEQPEGLVEIHVTRPADSMCWELTRPSNGQRMATPVLAYVAEEALDEVRRAGGRAIVTYDDQNSLTLRVARQREREAQQPGE